MHFNRTNMGRVLCALISVVALGAAGPALSFTAIDLRPLQVGHSWTYDENGVSVTETVVGTELVNGVSTFVVENLTGPSVGAQNFLTNDENGLRFHKSVVVPGVVGSSFVSMPPGTDLQAEFSAPSGFVSSGEIAFTFDVSTFPGTYEASIAVIGLEMLTVPAGTFQALRVDFDAEITVTARLITLTTISTGSEWYAAGIGVVRSIVTVDGNKMSRQLVSTNVPEPSAGLVGSAALTVLAGLAQRSRGIRPRLARR